MEWREKIAMRAYYLSISGQPGSAVEHWKQAEKTEWLEWLVVSRSANQSSAIELHKIIKDYPLHMRQNDIADVAQLLLSVVFSLWRAVFLADAQPSLDNMMKHVDQFLDNLIRTNNVQFVHDGHSRSWSFRYYVQSASDRLSKISGYSPERPFLLPQSDGRDQGHRLSATGWWEYNQERLDLALNNFRRSLQATPM